MVSWHLVQKTTVVIALLSVCGLLCGIRAQEIGSQSQTTKLLNLKKAQVAEEEAKDKFDRALKLRGEGLNTEEDLARARIAYLQAQVDYQEALSSFMGSDARLSVASAVKFQDANGKKSVRVALRYSSKELKELAKLKINAADLFPLDFMKEIKDVSVSLKSEGKVISDPYEKVIAALPLETEQSVTFQLLKDVESVDIDVFYAGKSETTSVYLQQGVSANLVTMNSAQFSQEADLGGQAVYELSLEKFPGEADVFKLGVLNLPSQLNYEFYDAQSNARLSQIKFTEGVTSMKLALKLFLPENADADVAIDKPIEFYALAMDNDQAARLQELRARNRRVVPSDIDALKVGSARLELIPRGVGKIELQAVNLYHEIKIGEEVQMEVQVKNVGTRKLNNIRVFTDLPLSWRSEVKPDLVAALEQGKEETVTVRLIPPADVTVGDYEPKIRTECSADNRKVESEDKTVRIHIAAKTNLLGISLLLLALVGLLMGIVVFGIKLTRR
jgi:hypothetical protein